MTFSTGVGGAGHFGSPFAHLFHLHPGVKDVYVVDEIAERAAEAVDRFVDAVAIFAQRGARGPLVESPLRAGKHVYSSPPCRRGNGGPSVTSAMRRRQRS